MFSIVTSVDCSQSCNIKLNLVTHLDVKVNSEVSNLYYSDRTRLHKRTVKITSMTVYALVVVLCAGERVPCSVGGNFTPHVIAVNAGEVNSLEVFFDRVS